jgi:hypothetical protein
MRRRATIAAAGCALACAAPAGAATNGRIAFTSFRDGGDGRIHPMAPDGSAPATPGPSGAVGVAPATPRRIARRAATLPAGATVVRLKVGRRAAARLGTARQVRLRVALASPHGARSLTLTLRRCARVPRRS